MSHFNSTTALAAPARIHRDDIDGLRAIAVLSVIAFHIHTPGFTGGFVGVDVFFVISGYLISSILVREIEQNSFHLAAFYERRFKRILPALFAVLLFCLIASVLLLSPIEAAHLGEGITATALSISNIQFYLQGSYFSHGGLLNPLLMTWSLAVEEQFYIVFPVLLLLLYKAGKRSVLPTLVLLCILSFALSVYTEARHPEFNFYLPFTRAWELGAGCLLAIWQAHTGPASELPRPWQHALGVVGLLLIAASVFFYSPATRFPGYEAVPPVLGAALLLASPASVASRVLSLRPLTLVGVISYSLYLWHWPLLSIASIIHGELPRSIVCSALMLLAAALAILSYRFIETPFRTARYPRRSVVIATYAAALVAFMLAGRLLSSTSGLPQRAPVLAQAEASLELERFHDCIDTPDRGPILTAACIPPPSASPAIALLGDSHAEALAPALREVIKPAGLALFAANSYSCPPLVGYTRWLPDEPVHASACAHFNQTVLALLASHTEIRTVLLTGAWAMVAEDKFTPNETTADPGSLSTQQSTDNLLHGLHDEIAALEAQGKRVILIDDVPSLDFTPIDQLRDARLPLRALVAATLSLNAHSSRPATTVPRSQALSHASEQLRISLLRLAQADPRLSVVDTKSLFCDSISCAYSDGHNLYYTDNNHVSRFGANLILSKLPAVVSPPRQ